MRILDKTANYIRGVFYSIVSKWSKKRFDNGTIDTYAYLDELFFKDRIPYDQALEKYSYRKDIWKKYWADQNSFSVKIYFPETYRKVETFLFDDFIPLFETKPDLIDIGCASGEWTLILAPHCSSIDGFEYSDKMVDSAKKTAEEQSVNNVSFFRADARSIKLDKQYDGGVILGMLMYIDDAETILQILENVYHHLKPGAFLCTRDSLNNENTDIVYILNRVNGYTGFYWSKPVYYEQFKKAGFVLKKETVFECVNSRRLQFIHIGNIWQKPL